MLKGPIDRLKIDMKPVKKIIANFNNNLKSNLITMLQQTQDEYGYLPKPVLKEISKLTDIPLNRIFGVVTFYSQFTLIPRGKYAIRVCNGTACHVKGVEDVKQIIKDMLNVEEGQTTSDSLFTLETVACFGTCFLAPVMMIDERYFGELTTKKVPEIIEKYSIRKT